MGNEQSSLKTAEAVEAEERAKARHIAETNAQIDKLKEENVRKDSEVNNTNDNPRTHIPSEALSLRPSSLKQSSPQRNDILQSFHPRKERLDKSKMSESTTLNNVSSASSRSDSNPSKRLASEVDPECTNDLSILPKICKRTPVASPKSPERKEVFAVSNSQHPPKWYIDLKPKNSRTKGNASVEGLLAGLRTQIRKCQESARNGYVTDNATLERVRFRIHKLMFEEVTEELLKTNRMLHNEDGLPQLFNDNFTKGVKYPFDIRADARELYTKWYRRVFDADLFRGIVFNMKTVAANKDGARISGDSIDQNYEGTVSAKFHGNGDLINGQWWPTLLCALRDGAHGQTVAGISGIPGEGACSIFMSSGHGYDDKDEGKVVYYCGTDSTDGSVTEPTRHLLDSYKNERPVRLLRSAKLNSEYAPTMGFRYDGLYKVVNYENLDGSISLRQRHQFKLKRLSGQDPIRGGNGPAKRPTEEEEAQYRKHRALVGRSSI